MKRDCRSPIPPSLGAWLAWLVRSLPPVLSGARFGEVVDVPQDGNGAIDSDFQVAMLEGE